MRSIILQYSTSAQQNLLDVAIAKNKPYADKFGLEYQTNNVRRCPERSIYWEKIAYLNEFLPTVEDGSLVVWMDADSLIVGNEDMKSILPPGRVFGMVQMRGGADNKKLINWYNAGVLAMVNGPVIRDFLDRVWKRADANDESSINAELKHTGGLVGDSHVLGLDVKWNCWDNNSVFCPNPVVRSFHGIGASMKLSAIQTYMGVAWQN